MWKLGVGLVINVETGGRTGSKLVPLEVPVQACPWGALRAWSPGGEQIDLGHRHPQSDEEHILPGSSSLLNMKHAEEATPYVDSMKIKIQLFLAVDRGLQLTVLCAV
ncbi:hypothetical protein AGIG_G20381 [Arapaima gigas]